MSTHSVETVSDVIRPDTLPGVPLLAKDNGSRARNLHGDHSDHDPFVIYLQPPENYVGVGTDQATTTRQYEPGFTNGIDLHGWDLRKFVGSNGVVGSNPMAMEFVNSNIVYVEHPVDDVADAMEAIQEELESNFKPYAYIQHNRSKAASNYNKYIEQDWVIEGTNDAFESVTNVGDVETVLLDGDHVMVLGGTVWERLDPTELDDDLVRRSTHDPSVHRSQLVMESLLRAAFVEETKRLPPIDAFELLDAFTEWDTYDEALIADAREVFELKRGGHGDAEIGDPFGDWIRGELGRDIDPVPYVQRQPDSDVINEQVERIVNAVGFY